MSAKVRWKHFRKAGNAVRCEEGPKAKSPKQRRSGTETIRFLLEKREDSRAQHTEEMKL